MAKKFTKKVERTDEHKSISRNAIAEKPTRNRQIVTFLAYFCKKQPNENFFQKSAWNIF